MSVSNLGAHTRTHIGSLGAFGFTKLREVRGNGVSWGGVCSVQALGGGRAVLIVCPYAACWTGSMKIDEVSFGSDRIARYNSVSCISTSELACAMNQMLKDLVSLDRGILSGTVSGQCRDIRNPNRVICW